MNNQEFFDFINNPTLAITNGNSATAGLRSLKKYPSNYQYLQILYEGLPDAQKLYNAKHRIIINPISACGNPAKFDTYSTGYLDLCSNKDCKICEEIRINAIVQSQIKYNQFTAINISDAKLKENSEYLKSFISNYTLRQINSALNKDDKSCSILELYSDLEGDKCSFEKLYLAINELREPPKAQCNTHYAEFVTYEKGYSTKCSMGFRCQDYKNIKLKEQSSYRKEHAAEIGPQGFKAQSTMQEKYSTSDANHEIFKEKRIQTNNERYGTEHPMQSSIIKEKSIATTLDRYGVRYANQHHSVKSKIQDTNLQRYGTKTFAESKAAKLQVNESRIKRFKKAGYTSNFKSDSFKLDDTNYSFTCDKCNNIFNHQFTEWKRLPKCPICYPSGISSIHMELYEYIEELYDGVIINNDRTAIKPQELDIFLPEKNIAFEMNGLFWHNIDTNEHITEIYHQDKYLKCKENGITLYNIFEDDWLNKKDLVKKMIYNIFNEKENITNTQIKELTITETQKFFNTNTYQKYDKSEINIGLVYKNEIKSVISFSKMRNGYKLNQYISNIKDSYSEIFEYFKEKYKPEFVIGYSNPEYNQGLELEALGFVFNKLTYPQYTFVVNEERLTRKEFLKGKDISEIIENYEFSLSEEENLFVYDYYKIYDCGNARYIWKKN